MFINIGTEIIAYYVIMTIIKYQISNDYHNTQIQSNISLKELQGTGSQNSFLQS